jgi:hypothetical protein
MDALDDRNRDRLGPAETLLLEAEDRRFAYHGTMEGDAAALLAQARAKLTSTWYSAAPW